MENITNTLDRYDDAFALLDQAMKRASHASARLTQSPKSGFPVGDPVAEVLSERAWALKKQLEVLAADCVRAKADYEGVEA